MRIAVTILLALVWFVNYMILSRIYDVSNYEGYMAFWKTRAILYDCLFFLVSLCLYLSYSGIVKAISLFMIIVTLGAICDEWIFSIAGYVYSDIVLVVLGLIVSISYGRGRRKHKDPVC